jgi:flagellin-specific chaperone FliS
MTKSKKWRRKNDVSEQANLLETLQTHYQELKAKNEKYYATIQKRLISVRKAIRRYDSPAYYHKRNRALRLYLELQQKKEKYNPQAWEKNFVRDISPILDRYEQILQSESCSKGTNTKPNTLLSVVPVQDKIHDLDHTFLTRHKKLDFTLSHRSSSNNQIDECMNPHCKHQSLIVIPREARVVCPGCAQYSKHFSAPSSNYHYSEEIENNSQHAYERRKNFKAYLSQYHKDAKPIPPELIQFLFKNIRKILHRTKAEVKSTPIKNLLKASEKWKKYVDCAAKLANILNRRNVPSFTQEQIDLFVYMFDQIQIPFLQFKTIDRTNFMNSSYLMNKFLGLVKMTHYQAAFPVLRHRKTLEEQDITWALICAYIDWDFERSI